MNQQIYRHGLVENCYQICSADFTTAYIVVYTFRAVLGIIKDKSVLYYYYYYYSRPIYKTAMFRDHANETNVESQDIYHWSWLA